MGMFTTPREVALQDEVNRLSAYVKYLEWKTGTPPNGLKIGDAPIEETTLRVPNTRVLHIAAESSVEYAKPEFAYRVVAKYLRGPEALSYSYFVDEREVLGANDQATLCAYLHERLVRAFAGALRKRNGS